MVIVNTKNMKRIRNVVATMAIEDMYLSKEFVNELIKVSNGEKTSEQLRQEVIKKYFSQCYANKDNFDDFIRILADNYGDLNALHPFREGNGRAQREFARLVCFECGYDFNLSCATHKEMLEASKLSFNIGDSSAFVKIFSKAISPHCEDVWY